MRVEFHTPNGRLARVPESLVDRYTAAGWSRVTEEPKPEPVAPEPDEKPRPVKRSPRRKSQ